MDIARIQELVKLVAENDVAEVEVEEKGIKIVVRKSAPTITMQAAPMYAQMPYPAPMPYAPMPGYPPPYAPPDNGTRVLSGQPPSQMAESEAPAAPAKNEVTVRAPIVGTFYSASSPDAPPYVQPGSSVSEGETLCIIEAMKLMNEIESEVTGTVKEVLVENAQPVEYDQPLFVITT